MDYGTESDGDSIKSYVSEKFGVSNSDFLHGVFNMLKCFIGLGILANPYGFREAGLWFGIISIWLSGGINFNTMML